MKIGGNFFELGREIKLNLQKLDKRLGAATKQAVTTASEGLKNELRQQVIGAGLGQRLANTWRNAFKSGKKLVFPATGNSKDAAAIVFSRAPEIIAAFDQGTLIKSKNGVYLAIPTANVPIGQKGKKLTPGEFERRTGLRLHFVFGGSKNSVLVARGLRKSYSKKSGQFRGYKVAGEKWKGRGKEIEGDVVMFVLIPSVQAKKLLYVRPALQKWGAQIKRLVSEALKRSSS